MEPLPDEQRQVNGGLRSRLKAPSWLWTAKRVYLPSSAIFAKGSPGVKAEIGADRISYSVQACDCFAWAWLCLVAVAFVFSFYFLSQGQLRLGRNGPLISNPTYVDYIRVGLWYLPLFVGGLSLAASRYLVQLSRREVVVRWRILLGVGWTWRLAVVDGVDVALHCRDRSLLCYAFRRIALKSGGRELCFGDLLSFLDEKTQKEQSEYLAAAVQAYYGGEMAAGLRSR